MKPSVLIFDLDGTLCDPREGFVKSISYALEKMGLPTDGRENYHRYIGPPLQDTMAELLGKAQNNRVLEAIENYRERYRESGIFENAPYIGIREALERLAERFPLYLATSKPGPFAEIILAHFNLIEFFQGIYGSEMDGANSDKGDIIKRLMREEQVAAETARMIGDRRFDIEGARINNMRAFGVAWGYGEREELLEARPEAIFETPASMADYFLQGAGTGSTANPATRQN